MLASRLHKTRGFTRTARTVVSIALICFLTAGPAFAGLLITGTNGITVSGADGVQYIGTSGITASGADGLLTFSPNGITATGVDGITATGADGITANGADGYTYTGANGITATGADALTVERADGITASGADGITATGADGTTYRFDSIEFRSPTGITATGADGITAAGADGITAAGADGITAAGADGITATGADGITISGADGITATGADGQIVSLPPGPLQLVGADLLIIASAQGITIAGADSIETTGADNLGNLVSQGSNQVGLRSVDPELAATLNNLTDDSNINAVAVFHHLPTESDLADLSRIGILGGTRFHSLPMVVLTGTRAQIIAISQLPSVRSIYGNRTLNFNSEPEVRSITGVDRAWRDSDLTARNGNLSLTGRNVTVAVLDSGIDGTQPDLAGRIAKNVKLADAQSVGLGFAYPNNIEGLPNTDLILGHGTFVGGLIAGSGARSNGRYQGVAPQARLVGLSAGDLTLLYVLEGFDYLLSHPELGVKVVNCSFSANTVFDVNDPVNVATRMLSDSGVNLVFSAGNTGPGQHTLNPYAVAPWVISVGATDTQGRLASFSSRGDFASALFHPTIVAPGVSLVSLRAAGILNVTGVEGLAGGDAQRLSLLELPFYTTASGTSFSAPQVAGTIALMLEADPTLTPAEVRDILQRSATPLAPYYQHEAGAGMLNAHAAVLQAAFPSRRIGAWRSTLDNGQVEFVNDPLSSFAGVVQPGGTFETSITIPNDSVFASVNIGWGPLLTINDLSLSVYDPSGSLSAQSNNLNLPGLTGRSEHVTLNMPTAGTWRIRVRNTLGLNLTPQAFNGVLQIGRVRYARLNDVENLDDSLRSDIYSDIRAFSMSSVGSKFRPEFSIKRSELASALFMVARVPQYVAAQPAYRDVRDTLHRLYVESVQALPAGSLFVDTASGGSFKPDDRATRLVAAIALVRAAGWRSDAEALAGTQLPYSDAMSIPAQYRGYVSVAVSRGLMQAGTSFRPGDALTRGELARGAATILRRSAP